MKQTYYGSVPDSDDSTDAKAVPIDSLELTSSWRSVFAEPPAVVADIFP